MKTLNGSRPDALLNRLLERSWLSRWTALRALLALTLGAIFISPAHADVVRFSASFDGVAAPALPVGWTTTANGSQSAWISTTAQTDTPPNAVFSPDPAGVGVNELTSPAIAILAAPAQLTFRHAYNLENIRDGGVLEIKIGAGAFQDIVAAGGSFSAGGYTGTLTSGTGNPLAGRPAWTGDSGGFITSTVSLPAAVAGQTIQLRWRCGADGGTNAPGWFVDSVVVTDTGTSLNASYTTGNEVPVTSNGFTATGTTVNFTLNFAPAVGTQLMVVRNTGLSFLNGTFTNLAQGQTVGLSFSGVSYNFVANYYGGTGNDLVLMWKDSRALAWGDNQYGQLGNNGTSDSGAPVAVSSGGVLAGKTVVSAAAGGYHSLALCSDGTVAAWGYNFYGQLGNSSTGNSSVPVAVSTGGVLAGKTVVSVAAGYDHCLALCSDGTIAAWGFNLYGQLGNSSTTSSSVPVVVSSGGVLAGKTVVSVAAGYLHSLALCSDSTVVAWGVNWDGQLGNNTTINSSVPVTVSSGGVLAGKTVVSVAAGYDHCLALCSDGTMAAWGLNSYGQLGNTTTNSSSVPVAVSRGGVLAGKTVTSTVAGGAHSLALCSDGTVAAWGRNGDGQLGNNSTTDSAVPVAVSSNPLAPGYRFMGISQGSVAYHGLALVAVLPPASPTYATNPATYFAGVQIADNLPTSGGSPVDSYSVSPLLPLGLSMNPGTGVISGTPTATAPMATYTVTASNVAGSTTGTLSIRVINTLSASYATGNEATLTGSGFSVGGTVNFTLNYAPVAGTQLMVVRNTGLGFISGRFSNLAQGQTVVLNYNGATYNFVANYYGGTGNDLVLVWKDSRVFAWGDNAYGQLGNNSTSDIGVPVAVSSTGVLAGKIVVGLAAGGGHSLALCSDGTVAAWGGNFYGQLGNNTTSDSSVPVAVSSAGVLAGKTVVSVAVGASHSLALCSDGTVAAWGFNINGQLGNNATSSSRVPVLVNAAGVLAGKTVVSVAAGGSHSMALCSDGTLLAWGYNYSGQLGNNGTTDSKVPVAVSSGGSLRARPWSPWLRVPPTAWRSARTERWSPGVTMALVSWATLPPTTAARRWR